MYTLIPLYFICFQQYFNNRVKNDRLPSQFPPNGIIPRNNPIHNASQKYQISPFNSIAVPLNRFLFVDKNDIILQNMSESEGQPKRPEFISGVRVKAPQDYDFDTKGRDFSEYNKEFKLRTDAVWEKTQLKDWFRCANKVFFFNKKDMKYYLIQPDDSYSNIIEPWGFEDNETFDYTGYTRTGMSTHFQVGLGPKERVENTFNSFYSMPDYYIMCAMRFEKWFKCDSVYHEDRSTEFDMNPERGLRNLKLHEFYPCYKEWYEATYACADNILKYLVELAYSKRAHDFFQEDASSVEIRSFPTIFDSPSAPERVTFTY